MFFVSNVKRMSNLWGDYPLGIRVSGATGEFWSAERLSWISGYAERFDASVQPYASELASLEKLRG